MSKNFNFFFSFLVQKLPKKNDITEDQWRMYHEFLLSTKGELKNFKDEEAWPTIIDEFVDYCREKKYL